MKFNNKKKNPRQEIQSTTKITQNNKSASYFPI